MLPKCCDDLTESLSLWSQLLLGYPHGEPGHHHHCYRQIVFGVVLGALACRTHTAIGLTIDSFTTISDNAERIAEFSQLDEWLSKRRNVLDAAGNTNAAVGNCLAVGSAAVVTSFTRVLHDPVFWRRHDAARIRCACERPTNEMVKETVSNQQLIQLNSGSVSSQNQGAGVIGEMAFTKGGQPEYWGGLWTPGRPVPKVSRRRHSSPRSVRGGCV